MLHVDDDVVMSPSAHCSFDAGYQMKQASVRRVERMTSPAERPPPCVTSLSTVSDVSFTMPAYYDGTEHGVAEQRKEKENFVVRLFIKTKGVFARCCVCAIF